MRLTPKIKTRSTSFKRINPLYGLVLTGGKSTRMQTDKSRLEYHGQKQSQYCFDLLSQYCDKVFISNRREQESLPGHKGFPQIHDLAAFQNVGPLGGILSAMAEYPQADWLVLACDLPYVNAATIERLIQKRDRRKIATAYVSVQDGLPEPLCALYEAKSRTRLLKFFKKGVHCPRQIMLNSNVALIKQKDKSALENVNSPEEFKRAVARLKGVFKHQRS